ncbi:porin [Vibrio pacinii]|uniref:porin n=1 Tax=Vibrio pacinii TaxID=170674 RepID=UPI00056FE933|nr:porin [Vibrio pacinii]
MDKMFKRTLLGAAVAAAMIAAPAAMANTESAVGGEYVEKLNEFIEGSSLSSIVITDTRYRSKDTGSGYTAGQDYTDYNVGLNFSSGFHNGWLGFDAGGYFSGSVYNNTGCSEITLCDGWDRSSDSLKLTTAALKFKGGETETKIGFLQSHGIGTVGNVWSFVPGTYRGATVVAPIGSWTLGYIFTDDHSAPWWENTNQSSFDDEGKPNGENAFNSLQSLGVNGSIGDVALNLGVGYARIGHGEDNTSYKFMIKAPLFETASLAFDFYGVSSDVDYDGLGYMAGLSYAQSFDALTWNSEVRYADSDNNAAVTPRTVRNYGSNNGTFSQYWNALSDWDQSGQLSWYNKLSYSFGDGWFVAGGVALSTVDDNNVNTYDSEYAVNADIGYSLQSGSLKGSTIKLHLTQLTRDMNDGSEFDWQDIRFQVIIPYNFF